MADLTGKAPKATYKDLLQVSNGNSGIDSTLRVLEDGEGTSSVLKLSTADVEINGIKYPTSDGTVNQVMTTDGSGQLSFAAPVTDLDGLSDVTITSASTGEFLRYNGSAWVDTLIVEADISDLGSYITASSTDTLTNKTINTASNTITVVEADISDLGSYITASSTDTLTNKTFDANGTGNSLSNVDVADLANGTDGELITWDASAAPATVAAGTATHVLTSNGAGAAPTFQAVASGGVSAKEVFTRSWGYASPGSLTSGVADVGLCDTIIETDASSTALGDADGLYFQQTTSTTDNNVAYLRTTQARPVYIAADTLAFCAWKFKFQSTSDIAFQCGFSNNTGAADIPAADHDTSIYLRYDTDVPDTNFQFCHSATSAAATIVDTGVAATTDAYIFTYEFTTSTNCIMTLYDDTGTSIATTTATTNLPDSVLSYHWCGIATRTTAAKTYRFYHMALQSTIGVPSQ